MSELIIIEQSTILGKQFNIYGDVENPLFLAKDVATWIEHSNTSKMLDMVDEGEKIMRQTKDSLGRQNDATFITEDGLYEILMRSDKPIAKQFKTQVKKLLKDLRLKRINITPSNYIDALKQLIISEEEKQRVQLERDEAIRLKAMVASGREGTLFSKTGVLTKQVNKLGKIVYELEIENEELYDENERFKSQDKTIRGFASLHHIDLDINECKIYGKELSKICREKNVEIHSVLFSGEKYPTNVYPHYELVKFFIKQGHDLNL